MYDYIKGEIVEISPTEAILDNQGIGYSFQISLQTFSKLRSENSIKLYVFHHLREDVEVLYGFHDKEERAVFQLLISVSGVGPNTARMMLSSLTSDELRNAILVEDVNKLKSVKGIGLKTAQRLIIELKDKITKTTGYSGIPAEVSLHSDPQKDEAVTALILLGFNKSNVEKVVNALFKENPAYKLEELIKQSLKRL